MNTTLLLAPLAICAIPLTSLLQPAQPSPNHVAVSSAPRPDAGPATYVGKITGWSVAANGSVALRLEGQRNKKSFSLWFATPANRNSTTRYEDLVLEAILAIHGHMQGAQVTVVSDSANEDSGRAVEDALVLSSLSQR